MNAAMRQLRATGNIVSMRIIGHCYVGLDRDFIWLARTIFQISFLYGARKLSSELNHVIHYLHALKLNWTVFDPANRS